MSKSRRQHLPALRGARPLRPATRSSPTWSRATTASRSPFSDEALERGGGARRAASGTTLREAPAGEPDGVRQARAASEFLDALADDFNTPRALAAVFGARRGGKPARALRRAGRRSSEMLPLLGLESLAEARTSRPIPRPSALLAEREGAREARDFERADRIRDELAALGWEVRDTAAGRAARAAHLNGRARDRSTAATPSPRRSAGAARVHRVLEPPDDARSRRADAARRLARPPGRRRRGRPLSLRRRRRAARAARAALIVALDQVQDPRNLGAVCRSAEVAGARGVVIRERRAAAGDAGGLQGVARERSSTSRSRGCETSPTGSRRRSAAGGWIYGADGGAAARYDEPDSTASPCSSSAARGRGSGRGCAARCDVLVSIPRAGRVESLNVSAAAAVLLFEVVRRRG